MTLQIVLRRIPRSLKRLSSSSAQWRPPFQWLSSSFSTQVTNPKRPRRALMSVPSASQRMIEKAKSIPADTIVLDLEDGVAPQQKDMAREHVQEALQPGFFSVSSEICVRINGLDTGSLAIQDLQAILPLPSLQSIVIPKVEEPSDIHFVSRFIDAICPLDQDVRIFAAIESAKGMLNLPAIAATSDSTQLDALIFASEDYCADLELVRTRDSLELHHARSQIVLMAKAHGLQAIDMVHIDFRNLDALREECQRGRELGFSGKQAIHPAQVEIIQETFLPSDKNIEFACRIVHEYERTTAKGQGGACVVDGIVVDAPVYKRALKIRKRAELANLVAE